MNIEDAIRIINGLDTSNSEENIEAKKMAVKALEKQNQKEHYCCYGGASAGPEGKREVSSASIPSRQSDQSTGAAVVAWRCSRILGEKVQDKG